MRRKSTDSPSLPSPAPYVVWDKGLLVWRVRIRRGGKSIFYRQFRNVDDAIRAAQEAMIVFSASGKKGVTPKPRAESTSRPKVMRSKLSDDERRERIRQRVRTQRMERNAWYRLFMDGQSCKECGARNGTLLHWHHRPGEAKNREVSQMVASCSMTAILAEMAKCDVLCKSCHQRWHMTERWAKKRRDIVQT